MSSDILFLGSDAIKTNMLYKTVPLSLEERARLRQAEPYIEALRTLIEGNNDKHYEGYFIIGNYYELRNKYDEALKYYNSALASVKSQMKRENANRFVVSWQRVIEKSIKRVNVKKAR